MHIGIAPDEARCFISVGTAVENLHIACLSLLLVSAFVSPSYIDCLLPLYFQPASQTASATRVAGLHALRLSMDATENNTSSPSGLQLSQQEPTR